MNRISQHPSSELGFNKALSAITGVDKIEDVDNIDNDFILRLTPIRSSILIGPRILTANPFNKRLYNNKKEKYKCRYLIIKKKSRKIHITYQMLCHNPVFVNFYDNRKTIILFLFKYSVRSNYSLSLCMT